MTFSVITTTRVSGIRTLLTHPSYVRYICDKAKSIIDTAAKMIAQLQLDMLLTDASRQYLASKRGMVSDQTVLAYTDSLRVFYSFIGDTEVRNITPAIIEQFRSWLLGERIIHAHHPAHNNRSGRYSIASVRKHLGHIGTFLQWCVDNPCVPLAANPMRGLKKPKLPKRRTRAIAECDVDAIRATIDAAYFRTVPNRYRPIYVARNRAIVEFLYSTGCRLAGLCGVTISDVTFDDAGGWAMVCEKGDKERNVILETDACLYIMEWLDVHPNPHPNAPLFCKLQAGEGEPLNRRSIHSMMKRLGIAANVSSPCNPHAFRHAAVNRWIAQHGVAVAQVLAGHSDIRTTIEVYGNFSFNQVRNLVNGKA